ncbi:MAG: hypothetical protein JSS34_03290 [Proteobacteria bacterium]|nr:hypothetical protein [Pseudomonadota bacterium]
MKIPSNLPSDRTFGLFFAGLFLCLFSWSAVLHHHFSWPILGTSLFLSLISCLFPKILRPFNMGWYFFGKLLHKITNPLIMGFIFFGILTPIGILRRLTKSESFPKYFDASLPSYWIKRLPPGPDSKQLKDQY